MHAVRQSPLNASIAVRSRRHRSLIEKRPARFRKRDRARSGAHRRRPSNAGDNAERPRPGTPADRRPNAQDAAGSARSRRTCMNAASIRDPGCRGGWLRSARARSFSSRGVRGESGGVDGFSRMLGSRVGHLGHDRPAIRNRLARRVRRDRRALRRRLRKCEQRSIRVRTELQRRGRDQPSRRRWGVRRDWFGSLVPTSSCSQVGCVQPGARRHRWHDRNDVRVRATREQPVLLSGGWRGVTAVAAVLLVLA